MSLVWLPKVWGVRLLCPDQLL